MGLSLFEITGRAQKMRAENCSSALPYSRSCRRSEPVQSEAWDRSPALPYPPHEHYDSITSGGGCISKVKMGSFLKLIFWYNFQRWVHF
jgi:hypothetical protein